MAFTFHELRNPLNGTLAHLDFALRAFNLARQQLALNRLTFTHTRACQQ